MLLPQACRHGQSWGFPWVGSECAWRSARLLPSPTPGGVLSPSQGPGLPWASHSLRDSCQDGPGGLVPTTPGPGVPWRHLMQASAQSPGRGRESVKFPSKMETNRDRQTWVWILLSKIVAQSLWVYKITNFIICKVENIFLYCGLFWITDGHLRLSTCLETSSALHMYCAFVICSSSVR